MPLYRYQSGSLLDEVSIITNESGGVRAYLHAPQSTSAEQLKEIQASFESRGWKTVPTLHEGKPVLEVRGFKKIENALTHLEATGWVKGNADVSPLDGDVQTEAQKRQNSTLKFAGISYLVGDAGYMYYALGKHKLMKAKGARELAAVGQEVQATSQHLVHAKSAHLTQSAQELASTKHGLATQKFGELQRDNKISNGFNVLDIAGGIGYALGSLALTFYGSRDQSQNTIHSTTEKVNSYLRQQQVEVDDGSAIKAIIKEPKRSFFGKIDHWLAKYPSEALNLIYVGVGGALTLVGMYHVFGAMKSGDKKALGIEIIETGLGFTTATSALAGLTIKEKKRPEGQPRKTGLAGVWEWIEEKPLRATGIGYGIATAFHGWGTVQKYRQGDEVIRKTIGGRGLFVASNVLSEVLLTFSSKGHGTGVKPDESVDQTVLAATADTIARQPLDQQDRLVAELSSHLSSPDIMGGKAEDIAKQLKTFMQALKDNPWADLGAKPVANDAPALPLTMEAGAKPQTQVHAAKVEPKNIERANDNEHAANDNGWQQREAKRADAGAELAVAH